MTANDPNTSTRERVRVAIAIARAHEGRVDEAIKERMERRVPSEPDHAVIGATTDNA
jgi:hypothetical protein